DLNDQIRTRLVAIIIVKKNKKKWASYSSRANAISFFITLILYLNIYLANLITIRAIINNAFKPSFKSVNALLY
ncbi:hypothetical protein V2W45_1242867, partial [Cenococcum geophilum]